MQVNITILVMVCSLRAEDTNATTQTGTPAPLIQVHTSLQRQRRLPFVPGLLGGLFLYQGRMASKYSVGAGKTAALERLHVGFKAMGIPYNEHPARSGEEPQVISFAVLSLFRFTSFISFKRWVLLVDT